jgi:hypothetical protein
MKKTIDIIQSNLHILNNSKLFTGIIMICLNIGSKFITIKLTKSQEEFMKNYVTREILIFAVCWMGTRDILISFLLTFVFFIITEYLFNEESSLCVVPQYLNNIKKSIDLNNDGNISQDEITQAVQVLTKAKDEHMSKQKEDVYKYFLANKY